MNRLSISKFYFYKTLKNNSTEILLSLAPNHLDANHINDFVNIVSLI